MSILIRDNGYPFDNPFPSPRPASGATPGATPGATVPAAIATPGATPAPTPSADPQALATLRADVARLEAKVDRLLLALNHARATQTRTAFTVEEVAELLGKTAFTVREWCRLGRINAGKRHQKQGKAPLWSIASGEVERIKNEGLLEPDAKRNAV